MNRFGTKAEMKDCTTYGFRCLHHLLPEGWLCDLCQIVEYEPPKPEAERQAEEIQRDTEWLGEVTK